jgi:hypothetical protein
LWICTVRLGHAHPSQSCRASPRITSNPGHFKLAMVAGAKAVVFSYYLYKIVPNL